MSSGIWLSCITLTGHTHLNGSVILNTSPLSVQGNPLVQRKGRIVRIHAETIDHAAGNRPLLSIRTLYSRSFCYFLKLFQQSLIHRIMHMSVKHIGSGIPLSVQPVLTVIAHHRIMAEDYLSLIVLHFRIGLYPHKPLRPEIWFLQKVVVISPDHI